MMITMDCMRMVLTPVMFMGMLGLASLGGALSLPSAGFASETETNAAATKDAVPKAIYDETQPGADDPRVKEGFAAYKAGEFKKAYDIWLPLAESGNAEAQFRVGNIYSFARGLEQNDLIAQSWWEKAAYKEHVKAMHNLAVVYDQGKTLPKNVARARTYYLKAVELCKVSSQYGLGSLILRQPKDERDNVDGHKWLEIAFMLGDIRAGEVSKKLVGLITTPTEYETAKKKAQEWLSNHSCK